MLSLPTSVPNLHPPINLPHQPPHHRARMATHIRKSSQQGDDHDHDRDRQPSSGPLFTIVNEEIKFARYATFYNRSIRFPDGQVHEFDIVGHPKCNFHFCVTFPYHPPPHNGNGNGSGGGGWRDGHVTLIREFCQGISDLVYCLPTGGYDPAKHGTLEACSRAELSEEAHLKGGTLKRLLADEVSVPEVKWCCNRFTPFIVIDPQIDEKPGSRDKEEYIEVVKVSIPELRQIMRSGEMLLPSVSTCWWALEYLMDENL